MKSRFKKQGKRKLNPLFQLGAMLPSIYFGTLRRWMMRWGATPEEARKPLPGDDMVPKAGVQYTRAITINAPAEKVWPWLIQIGQGRGGFYSYDWLENLAGIGIHSASEIVPEWQNLKVGETVNLAPDVGLPVTVVEPGQALVLQGWGAFVLEEIDPQTTRLIIRTRVGAGLMTLLYVLLIEIPHFIMERKMLLGLKQRVESALTAQQTAATGQATA
ncbi:MAG: SRPBCC family protein [Chloroflexi bacterium]|nr:SRPBCC family protein [Chloroflexota bacterium]